MTIHRELYVTGLIEECAELIKSCTKIQRFGLTASHPQTGRTNKDEFIEEAGDVAAHIVVLCQELSIPYELIAQRAEHKIEKFKKRHNI